MNLTTLQHRLADVATKRTLVLVLVTAVFAAAVLWLRGFLSYLPFVFSSDPEGATFWQRLWHVATFWEHPPLELVVALISSGMIIYGLAAAHDQHVELHQLHTQFEELQAERDTLTTLDEIHLRDITDLHHRIGHHAKEADRLRAKLAEATRQTGTGEDLGFIT